MKEKKTDKAQKHLKAGNFKEAEDVLGSVIEQAALHKGSLRKLAALIGSLLAEEHSEFHRARGITCIRTGQLG